MRFQVLHYANNLEPEAPHVIPETAPPAEWPSEGRITFDKCVRLSLLLKPLVRD